MLSAGKQLRSNVGAAPASNFCQMLQEIAEVQRFEVTCFDITDRSHSGIYEWSGLQTYQALQRSINSVYIKKYVPLMFAKV